MARFATNTIGTLQDSVANDNSPLPNDWLPWEGGQACIHGDVAVEVQLRSGGENQGAASTFNWRHGVGPFGYDHDDDIIAYRVIGSAPTRNGDFIQTYTGRQYWPLDPRPDDVFVEDIAHSLSLQCRYAGHCIKFFSVAEHSVLIARYLAGRYDSQTALAGLLHDAPETYLVDVPRPVKPHLSNYKELEQINWNAVAQRFGLPSELPDAVHDADNCIIADELINLVPMDWHARYDNPLGVKLRFWSPEKAEAAFLATFEALTGSLSSREAA